MKRNAMIVAVVCFSAIAVTNLFAEDPLFLGPEEIVLAGVDDIDVPGYSVPFYIDWNNDGLKDLVTGQGSGTTTAKVRIYLNVGTESIPEFTTYFYAQSSGADLTCAGSGCLGCFPRVVYWDDDERKDLLIGLSNGTVKIYLNINTDNDPQFDGGTYLKVGEAGSKSNIDVGNRATCTVVDWNSNGRKDLVIGAYDGKIHLFINEGNDAEPDFRVETFAQQNDSDLDVPSGRSSPHVLDLDNDGKKDLLTGNTNGKLLFYGNAGSDSAPNFADYSFVKSDGLTIDLPGTPRSRPYVCDWTSDNYLDVLIGAGDGKVHLYQGLPFLGDFEPDGDVDFHDFAVLASAWQSTIGDDNFNSKYDISDPPDNIIDELDLTVFVGNWQAGAQ
ncbi:FG-GAP repeat domain-containing protein [Planctomycetota bacterium]